MKRGSLIVAGSGIKMVRHMTLEAQGRIERASHVFFLVTDPVTEDWIRHLNPRAESLEDCYRDGGDRMQSYVKIIDRILGAVRRGESVCAVFYGHPGVFAYPTHAAIRQARKEGYPARMLPGISAEDCLFADLGLDPGTDGCQSFEATDFLLRQRRFDPTTALLLWQIGVIGDMTYRRSGRYGRKGLKVLAQILGQTYPPDHEVVVYEASQFPVSDPVILRVRLADLPKARITALSTLYVPALGHAPVDRDMARRLGIPGPIIDGTEPVRRVRKGRRARVRVAARATAAP
jgi:uncharacterized protein YabN with tetrapyrrole methylase and pyrophosphatase domain